MLLFHCRPFQTICTITVCSLLLALGSVRSSTVTAETTGNVTAANSYFSTLTENEKVGYLNWLSDHGSIEYTRHIFLPAVTDPDMGAAVFWTFMDDDDSDIVSVERQVATTIASHIKFAVAVRATGWVALGLSEAGGMLGADIAMFEVINPTAIIDAYVLEDRIPIVDDCASHWTLVRYTSTTDGWLIVEMSRPLDTKDPQDRSIIDDTSLHAPTRLISAWGDTDVVGYHGSNVARSAAKLFGGPDDIDFILNFEQLMEEQADGYFDVRQTNYSIPETETTYTLVCKTYAELKAEFNLPETENGTLTFIGGGAIISPGSEPYVHHFIVSGSTDSEKCSDNGGSMLWGWAPGEDPSAMPENVGIPLFGSGSQFRSISIQTHYNNPNKVPNLVDSSGMRLYFTVTPREIEASWLQLADPFTMLSGTIIDSGLSKYSFSCGGECSSFVMSDGEPVTVISEGLHMHKTGVRMTNELIRDGQTVNLGAIDVYDYDQQGTYRVQQKDYQILPGDSFRTTCYYRDGAQFGLSSQQEMCIAFLLYYPRKTIDFGEFGEFDWVCVHGIDELPVCVEDLEVTALSAEEDLGRAFGSAPNSCSASVVDIGADDGEEGSSGVSTDPPDMEAEVEGNGSSSASTVLPTMAVAALSFVINTMMTS